MDSLQIRQARLPDSLQERIRQARSISREELQLIGLPSFSNARANTRIDMYSAQSQDIICADLCGKKLLKSIDMVNVTVQPSSPSKLSLPNGSLATDYMLYHEIKIPAITPIEQREWGSVIPHLINKNAVDLEHRKVFSDIDTFNLVQSGTFKVAYRSDENMLVCAPTGSGKTFIAILCILHELHQFESIEKFKKTPYKIVYVAPMKALAGEIVTNLQKRLESLDITVREFTGDMHLRAHEIHTTDILVTTPEKWDTVTRRNTGTDSLFRLVHLLIVDEVHLLNCDRGSVLEAIVARTFALRNEKTSRLRIIGLSATLPNYGEIAQFLHVKPETGLFYFNWGFRPVPLKTTFFGTKNSRNEKHWDIEDRICYNKLKEFLKSGQKVLIFVHSRMKSVNTCNYIEKRARDENDEDLFEQVQDEHYKVGLEILEEAHMKLLKKFYQFNMACHHAGMLRDDRIRVETLFREGYIKVLVSTTTLAWGVNLPAYAVIVKGTRYYNPSRSAQADVDLLDAQQMFGRAGRPQYDSMGEAVLITNQNNLHYYLSLFLWRIPIQSHLNESLAEHLNAEIVLKNVNCIEEGVSWLKRTFLYIRMTNQPDHYKVVNNDVISRCREMIELAADQLEKAGIIIFDRTTRNLESTDIGTVASYTYIKQATIFIINNELKNSDLFDNIVFLLCKSKEYGQIKVRPTESKELQTLRSKLNDTVMVKYANATVEYRKIAVLIYSYVLRLEIDDIQLYLDQIYIVQDAKRILRAYFEIAVIKRFASTAYQIKLLQKCLEHKCELQDHLLQFKKLNIPRTDKNYLLLSKYSLGMLKTLTQSQLESVVTSKKLAYKLFEWIQSLPFVKLSATCHRMTPDVIRINVSISPDFEWNDTYNGKDMEPWVMWILNPNNKQLFVLHYFSIKKQLVDRKETIMMDLNVELNECDPNVPDELLLHLESENWLGVEVDHKFPKDNFLPTGAMSLFA